MTKLELFNTSLKYLKDTFHKYGKFSDANAKLDEIGKLFSIYFYDSTIDKSQNLVGDALDKFKNDKVGFVSYLNDVFVKAAKHDFFAFDSGNSIFGNQPSLNLEMNDDYFCFNILKLIDDTYEGFTNRSEQFDFLNEIFGHFIRDNFRNNIEDAQYMTPQEVVDLVCEMAILNIGKKKSLTVCDPCCGVGSFITTFGKTLIDSKIKLDLIGQDKVPRMARLAKLNLNLLNKFINTVSVGNSLIGDSSIDKYKGKIDLILTNPPFGARFTSLELIGENDAKYPLLNDMFGKGSNMNSEILFVDKCLGLLKDGGHLFAVLPDSVISSKGIQEILRFRIMSSDEYFVKSIIELPVETFAQAGTRTKTSILHLVKNPKVKPDKIFIGKSNHLGFEVSSRKGVAVKKEIGENDLLQVLASVKKSFQKSGDVSLPNILCEAPSCVEIKSDRLKDEPWTPNHYDASKISSLLSFQNSKDYDLIGISQLLDVITKERRKEKKDQDSKCISVLHIVNGDLLDYEELLNYNPKYPGIVCKKQDLLFSKINPRIHRTLVVPDLDFPLTCSSEFEILNSNSDYSNYELKFLLSLPIVKKQLNHLTSGTSSSHNRIKTNDFLKIMIPIPKKNTKSYKLFRKTLKEAEAKYKKLLVLNIDKVKTVTNLVSEVYA